MIPKAFRSSDASRAWEEAPRDRGVEGLRRGRAATPGGGSRGPAVLLAMACLLAGGICLPLDADSRVEAALRLLRSPEGFDRERGESELMRQGAEAAAPLVKILEGSPDRLLALRVERIFTRVLNEILGDLERERESLALDRHEAETLRARQEAARIREKLRLKIQSWKKADPEFTDKIESLLRLRTLQKEQQASGAKQPPATNDATHAEIEKLRQVRAACRKSLPGFSEAEDDVLRLAELESAGTSFSSLNELERIRLQDLAERIAERGPSVARLTGELESLGLTALNGLLARRAVARRPPGPEDESLIRKAILEHEEQLLADMTAPRFERMRYLRGLLWAWEADTKGPAAKEAGEALARHMEKTIEDLDAAQGLVRRRAAVELYELGTRGLAALSARVKSASPAVSAGRRFLLHLLRWQIDPRTYERTGVDFRLYRDLDFRARRRRVFEYARAAGEDAIPTLKAIVMDESLEPSLFVRVGAAKALAGLRDLSGYEFLLLKHPDLTLTRPEVSRDLAIIQAVEYVRAKQYEQAIAELKKVLERYPFDFRANYHIAFAYLLLKNYRKAIHHFEIAKRVHPKDQLTLYNLACAYALSGKKPEALRELQAAVDAGFQDAEHIRNDTDLDSLRNEPAYRRILQQLGASGESKPEGEDGDR